MAVAVVPGDRGDGVVRLVGLVPLDRGLLAQWQCRFARGGARLVVVVATGHRVFVVFLFQRSRFYAARWQGQPYCVWRSVGTAVFAVSALSALPDTLIRAHHHRGTGWSSH